MTPTNDLPPRNRHLAPIHKIVGIAPQFERTDGGYFYRRDGCGPAIRVTAAERDGFVAAGLRSLLLHAAAFPLCGLAAWLLIARLLPTASDNVVGAVFGAALVVIATALYASQQAGIDAPAHALARRSPEKPARAPDYGKRPTYRGILALVAVILFLAAIGTEKPAAFYVAFASGGLTLGIVLAIRKFWSDGNLTPPQREQAADARRAEARHHAERVRTAGKGGTIRKGLLILFFLGIESIVLVGAIVVAVGVAGSVTGTTFGQMAFGPFIIAFLGGLALGGLLVWPIERLCKRWTGESAMDTLNFIPAGW